MMRSTVRNHKRMVWRRAIKSHFTFFIVNSYFTDPATPMSYAASCMNTRSADRVRFISYSQKRSVQMAHVEVDAVVARFDADLIVAGSISPAALDADHLRRRGGNRYRSAVSVASDVRSVQVGAFER